MGQRPRDGVKARNNGGFIPERVGKPVAQETAPHVRFRPVEDIQERRCPSRLGQNIEVAQRPLVDGEYTGGGDTADPLERAKGGSIGFAQVRDEVGKGGRLRLIAGETRGCVLAELGGKRRLNSCGRATTAPALPGG
jgi:hypothetical protein